ncbi:MAG: hypothetical protein M0Z39_03970 [Actinomycetota bacterium]|jgi:SpoVK/Ycf46/Vps4 family AAA+-type ATPase|nr:hypothetical protein [Actinomycetota bacterium]
MYESGADALDYEEITAASGGYSGAEISHIANKVAMASLKAAIGGEGGKKLLTEEVLSAISSTPSQVTPEQVAAYESIAARLSR